MNVLMRIFKKVQNRYEQPIINGMYRNPELSFRSDELVAQKVLMNQYRVNSSLEKDRLPDLKDVGFRQYSQFEPR